MFGKAIVRGLLAVAMVSCAVVAQADVLHMGPGLTSLETVWVTNLGNAADSTGYGAVGYSYRMGKYDVTAAQYTEFLNAKARTDTYGLYNTAMADPTNSLGCNIQRSGTSGSYTYSVASDWANRPVNYVCWYDCIRFANWLQNGQGSGDTETGTYTITGGGVNSGTVSIPSAATRATWTAANPHWVLPSEDEWYKAAYYDPNKPGGAGYWIYPTKSDTAPINTLLSPDPGNHANFYDYYGTGNNSDTIGPPYHRTEVGAFANSASAYGTFDQGGNVWQWNETVIGSSRGMRGGDWGNYSYQLASSYRYSLPPTDEYSFIGFRVASVPEPGSLAMLAGIALTALLYYWRKHV